MPMLDADTLRLVFVDGPTDFIIWPILLLPNTEAVYGSAVH